MKSDKYMSIMNKPNRPKNIVLIKKSGNAGKNLFLIHDGTGRVEGYFQLAQHIHPAFNIYGISPLTSGSETDLTGPRTISICALAGAYRQLIEQFNDNAPVYIAGWSSGGSIAYEMVHQWEKTSITVSFLGLLDTMPPQIQDSLPAYDIKTECEQLFPFVSDAVLKEKLAKQTDIKSFWQLVATELSPEDFACKAFMEEQKTDWAAIIPHYHLYPLMDLFNLINTIRSYYKASYEYRPEGMIRTPVHYFHARHSLVTRPDDWQHYCRTFNLYDVPGEHYTMLNNQNASTFAETFNRVLGSAAGKEP